MKFLVILFAIVAVVAAFPEPEQERERRGILAGPALGWAAGPKVAVAAAPIAIATAPKLLAAPAVAVAGPALAPAWGGLKAW